MSTFELPPELSADRPPERRGLARDQVRLLVIDRQTGSVTHTRFDQVSHFLRPGDLLVFNSSGTLPAVLSATVAQQKEPVEVRLAEHLPDNIWLALLLPHSVEASGLRLDFGRGLTAQVLTRDFQIPRLWRLRFSATGTELLDLIYRLGNPVRYRYVSGAWKLSYYQNVYAQTPGSSEMPSAGRAFSWRLLFGLRRMGIKSTHITLHTGLSSYMDNDFDRRRPMSEEEYWISEESAQKIGRAQTNRGRIIAVGTTVVRALESAVLAQGNKLRASNDYTRLRISDRHHLQLVNGLITGLHEPEASHLDLLSAFIPKETLFAAYLEAIQQGYLWHEFGDLNLIV
jgi:S-adenosylmethionine:tRNA ribosyltransferase-isomerase